MKLEKVIVLGASGHAKVVIDILEKQNNFEIVGIVDINLPKEFLFQGYRVLGDDSQLPEIYLNYPDSKFIVAIGDNWIRYQVVQKLLVLLPEIEFINAIHPSAEIANHVSIGKGNVIMPGVIINSGSQIGDFTIVNTRSNIDHDCQIHDFASVAPNAALGGDVIIGQFSSVSMACVIKNNILIGKHTILGAGSLVLKDFEDNLVVYGTPAKIIRTREIGEAYLS